MKRNISIDEPDDKKESEEPKEKTVEKETAESAASAPEPEEKKEIDFEAREKELVDQLQRLAAEFDNYRKKNSREYSRGREDGIVQAVEALLPTLESLALAIDSAGKTPDADALKQGVEAVRRQFMAGLESLGVKEIDVREGDALDPNIHEVMLAVPTEKVPPGHVIEALKSGYLLKERLIKPARVMVAREMPEEAEPEN